MKSMTGFGKAEWSDEALSIKVETRSVNSRNLRISIKLPDSLQSTSGEYESEIEQLIRDRLHRGTIYLTIECELLSGFEYSLNTETIKTYYSRLGELQRELGCEEGVSLSAVISLPGTLEKRATADLDVEGVWERAKELAATAIDAMVEMRRQEGEKIVDALLRQTKTIESLLSHVEARKSCVISEYQEKLHTRVSQLLEGTDTSISPDDLAREVAIFAERCDITEEIDRLRSHLDQLAKATESSGPAGRKLDFIAQEMFREANTMASKANDSEMIQQVIGIKGEIEKIREQVLNIE